MKKDFEKEAHLKLGEFKAEPGVPKLVVPKTVSELLVEMVRKDLAKDELQTFDSLLASMVLHNLAYKVPWCRECHKEMIFIPWENRKVRWLLACNNVHCSMLRKPQGHIVNNGGYSRGLF